ncbi:MAG: aldose 1-epimerase [Bdellovibrionales bacterium]|nr:aldose 1-epimerase [Oligoflexia bacterium]
MSILSNEAVSIQGLKIESIDVAFPAQTQGMVHFEVAPGIGASTVALDANVRGKVVHVFPKRDLQIMDAMIALDPNYAFKQVNVPLFPLSNRLLPENYFARMLLKKGENFEAKVEGISVKMPLNNVAGTNEAIPHHLHGLAFNQLASKVETQTDENVNSVVMEIEDFFQGYWTGKASLQIEQGIKDGIFFYTLRAKNTGDSLLPAGFGSHPYFQMPSGNPSSVKLRIPANELADIDNLTNVLPKGTLSSTSSNDNRLNFSQLKSLPTGVIDNYFILDPKQKKEIELVDEEAGIRYRFTALTPNIIGAQVFYPGQGSVIALEFVTHHPDPRAELWKKLPTGMQVLKPGEIAEYSYQISVEIL